MNSNKKIKLGIFILIVLIGAIALFLILKPKPPTPIKIIKLNSFRGTDGNGTGFFMTNDLVNKGTYIDNEETAVMKSIMEKIYTSLNMNVINNKPTEEQNNQIKSYNQIMVYNQNPLIRDGITYTDKVSKIIDGYLLLQNQGGHFFDENNYKGGIMNTKDNKVGDTLYFVISRTMQMK